MDIKWLKEKIIEYKNKTIKEIGDDLRIAIPVAALILSAMFFKFSLILPWVYATGSTIIITSILKLIFNFTPLGTRPNGNDDSMPSGHVSAAFGGAAFIFFGVSYLLGIIAFPFAAFTAYSRVWAGSHHWRDVIVGAILGSIISFIFATGII